MTEQSYCHDLLGYLSEYVDGTLREELCSELERHMAGCDRCQVVVNTLRKTIEIYRANGEMVAELPQDIRARLFQRLDLTEFLSGSQKSSV